MTDDMRPTPKLSNPEEVRQRLESWLAETVYPGSAVRICDFEIPENNGMSNITVMLSCEVDGGERRDMVGRLQAQGDALVFPDYDLPLQYAVMDMLGGVPGIAAPALVALEGTGQVLGMPFYIMAKTPGLIPSDIPPYHMDGWLCESTPAERREVWNAGVDMMAALHNLPVDRPPLKAFIDEHTFPKSLAEQLAYWRHYLSWALGDRRSPACETLLTWLEGHQPAEQTRRLCWGDSRMANVIFSEDKTRVAALLDWEMLCMGDPLQDLAWWIFMDEMFSHGLGVPPLEGIPGREQSVQRWCEKTGLSADELHYYLVFAGMRISVMLARMSLATGDGSMVEGGFAIDYSLKVLGEADEQ